MSETHNVFDASTIPAVPAVTPQTSDLPMDFQPLIEDGIDDSEFTPVPPYPTRKRNPWLIALIIVLVILLIGGGLLTYRRLTRPPAVQYTQVAATVGNLTVTVSGTGPVQAGAVYNLNFAASAPIQTIDVHVGQQVTQGQQLATLDPTSLQDALNQAQNNVNAAQNGLNNASTNLSNVKSQQAAVTDNAKLTEQTQLTNCALFGTPNAPGAGGGSGSGTGGKSGTPIATSTPGATPTPDPTTVANCKQQVTDQYNQTVDQANIAIANASNQVTSAQQQLTSSQTALQTAQDNLKNATLTAPHAGVIEAINGMVGENAGGAGGANNSGSNSAAGGTGSSGSSPFIVLADASTLSVAAQVNEANIASVAVNQPAQFTVAAYPSQTFSATVASIDTLGQANSNVVTYLVDLAVDMHSIGSDHVYPGMTATVNITTAERISTLLVPSAALSFSTVAVQNGELSASDLRSLVRSSGPVTGSRGIVVELQNGQLVPVLVTTGLTNGQEVEILSGLKEGDQVIIGQTGGQNSTTGGNGGGRGIFFGGGGGGGGFNGGGGNGGNRGGGN